MSPISLDRLRERLRQSFWVVPALAAVSAVLLALVLVETDVRIGDFRSAFLFPGPPEGARSLLGAIVSAMISFTGLVFSITVVVLVLTSGQFSPRVLRNFLRDRLIRWTLGVFVATFVYAMTVVRAVEGTDGHDAFVPRIAVTAAFVLVLASVGLFIAYIDHIANAIRVSTIIAGIAAESRGVLDRRWPADTPPRDPAPPRHRGAVTVTVTADKAGVVVSVDEGALVDAAAAADVVVGLVPRIGDFVPRGAPLLRVSEADDALGARLAACVALDEERTLSQDLAFGFRQLVDIAEKALSPGINDPTTACQALDAVHDLLRTLAGRRLPTGYHSDDDDVVRLAVPQYTFGDFLELAIEGVWHYGKDGIQVPARLRSMLHDLRTVALPEHRPALDHWIAITATSPA